MALGTLQSLGPFEVPGLDGQRMVRVYVPLSRKGRDRPKSALYLFDGQNVFDDAPSFAGGWQVHEAIDKLPRTTTFAPIVVGIDHGGAARIDELGPWLTRGRGGRTDALLDWMGSQLIPTVREQFALAPGPLGAVIGGSSMGGLAAIYAHFKCPDLFGGVIAMSPSFWFGDRAIFPMVAAAEIPPVSRIYLDCGEKEGGGRMIGIVREMATHLVSRHYGDDRLMWRADARGAHNEKSWRRRLPKALRFMYRRPS